MSELKEPFNPGLDDFRRRAEAAERTLVVLKKRVHQMYNEGSLTLVHKQLERHRRRRELVEVRAAELKRYTEHLEETVAQRTRAIKTILDNVTFGFLIVDRDLKVQEGFTLSCRGLFGREVAVGDDLAALLRLGSATRSQLLLGVDQVFEDLMDEEVTVAQLPSRFPLGDKVLRAEGRVVRADDGHVSGLLVTLSDIAALERAQLESHHHAVLVRILRQKTSFTQFIADARDSLKAAKASLRDQIFVRRAVHTVKGNAASYWLDDVVAHAHRAEALETVDAAAIEAVDAALRKFLKDNYAVLEVDYDLDTRQSFEIGADQLQRLRALLDAADADSDLRRWAAEVVLRPARDLLGPLHTFVQRLAERLDKDVRFELSGDDLLVDAEVTRPVFSTLTHLLRNSLDHGVEFADQRTPKPPKGLVSVEITHTRDAYVIVVADDGRGVDVEALGVRAVELGMVTADELAAYSPQERLELMFRDGLSAVRVATEVSGRGVGMSAVKSAVEQQGGTIALETHPGSGTRVTLRVPRHAAL